MTPLPLAVLLPCMANLCLVAVCAALFVCSRRQALAHWSLCWLAFLPWGTLLLWQVLFPQDLEGGRFSWLRTAGTLAAGAHAVFLVWAIYALSSSLLPPGPVGTRRHGRARMQPVRRWPYLAPALTLVGVLAAILSACSFPASTQLLLRLVAMGMVMAYGVGIWKLSQITSPGERGSLFFLAGALLALAAWQLGLVLPASGARFADRPLLATYLWGSEAVILMAVAIAILQQSWSEETRRLKDTMRQLAESQSHFRLIFEQSGVGMALLTPDGQFLEVNPALVQMLGHDSQELQGRRLIDLAHPEELSEGISRTEQGLDVPSRLYERDRRYLHKSGRTVWVRVLRVPLRDQAGRLQYLVAVLLDITQRRLAETALMASEQRYRLRFQRAFDGICTLSESLGIAEANDAFCQMLGYRADEMARANLVDIAMDLPAFQRHLQSVQRLGGDRLETRLRKKDGSAVDVEVSSTLMKLDGRHLIHTISRDISDRVRATEALRHAEETLREERDFITQVLETAEALIVVLDPQGRIVRFNAKCATLCGHREEDMRGQIFWEALLPPAAVETMRATVERVMAEQIPVGLECPWQSATGTLRLIAWRFAAVRSSPGQSRFIIGVGLDITEQKQLEDQLRQAQKMETLGTLVGGIAHDFNNQLTVILGNLDLLLETTDPGFFGHAELVDAAQAGRHCADMTQRLLTFSRRQMGETRPLDLNHLLADAARLLHRVLPATIAIRLETDPDLPAVNADPTQLHQMLMNLAVNARDAMPRGGTLTLQTAVQVLSPLECARHLDWRPGRFVTLAVSDTGVGMSQEVQGRIFEPFFTTKEFGEGTGLGLAMVFGIIKAHGGWINVASHPGQGSRFTIYLPALEAPVLPAPIVPRPPIRGGRECILAVDDEELIRKLARTILEQWGFRVLTAADGEEAVEIYRTRQHEIQLVLLDFTMPRYNGLQVMEMLKEINPEVPVVFSSGHTLNSDTDQLFAAGARAFVAKPYRPEELVRKIRQVLDDGAAEPFAVAASH